MKISAVIPCYNNARTIVTAAQSILNQSVAVDELLVIDDGSTDGSGGLVEEFATRVIRHPRNLGRGAARLRGLREAANGLVLSCDATIALTPGFVEGALPHFEEHCVSAVFGRVGQEDYSTVAMRWRGRHLLRLDTEREFDRRASLATGGVILRKEHVSAVGNFNASLRHSEDADLGARLLAGGYEVIFDPQLSAIALARNNLPEVLERYWRWYAGSDERIDVRGYWGQITHSRVMAMRDLIARDPLCIPVSLLVPHYQLWKSLLHRFRKAHREDPAADSRP